MAWPGDRVQQMVIAMTLFEGNLPQKRLRERERQRERERERVGCQMIWTAGSRAPQVEFLSSVLPVL